MFSRPGESTDLPALHRLPDGESLPETAYQIVHDEAMLDGNARLNLATFVGTWMDPYADQLYAESADKNMIDKDEYPQTAAIETRCWKMLADLWNAPDPDGAIGTSTIGSSEACMLGGLALKRRWQHARRAAGQVDGRSRTSILLQRRAGVLGEVLQLLGRRGPLRSRSRDEHKVLDGHDLDKYVDENTIGVVAIMGVTYTGMYEPVEEIAAALDEHPGRHRARHPDPRRRRLRRHDRPVPAAGPGVGLPPRRGSPRSAPPPTSTAWSTRASAGSSGARSTTCPTTSSSTSPTSAATCPPSR